MDSWPAPPSYWTLWESCSEYSPPTNPPTIPFEAEQSVTMFGAPYETRLSLPTLESSGMEQLFEGEGDAKEFRRLNDSLLLHYMDMLRGMRMGENQDERLRAMEKIFTNMHYLINTRRPQQARLMVRDLVRQNVKRQEELIASLEEACDEAERLLESTAGQQERKKIKGGGEDFKNE